MRMLILSGRLLGILLGAYIVWTRSDRSDQLQWETYLDPSPAIQILKWTYILGNTFLYTTIGSCLVGTILPSWVSEILDFVMGIFFARVLTTFWEFWTLYRWNAFSARSEIRDNLPMKTDEFHQTVLDLRFPLPYSLDIQAWKTWRDATVPVYNAVFGIWARDCLKAGIFAGILIILELTVGALRVPRGFRSVLLLVLIFFLSMRNLDEEVLNFLVDY